MDAAGNRVVHGLTDRDRNLLAKAGFEARRAEWLYTAPNPRVGALALCNGHVVGRGHHAVCGGPHAEEVALRDAGAWDESTGTAVPGRVDEMVVTLEPCSATDSEKRRPPCVESLLAAGVRRVVVGANDPDPRHAGRGLEQLRSRGVTVECANDSEGFAADNPAFLSALQNPSRPFVIAKWAASVDGKTANDQGVSQWITGTESRAEVHRLRACSDVVMAGAGTLTRDDPRLTARPKDIEADRQPLRVLVLPRNGIASSAAVFVAAGPRLWWTHQDNSGPADDECMVLRDDEDGQLDLAAGLRALRAERGVRRVFVEGGPQLQGYLLDHGLLDAVVRYEAPLLISGSHGALLGRAQPTPSKAWRLAAEERADLGPDLRRAFLLLAPSEA